MVAARLIRFRKSQLLGVNQFSVFEKERGICPVVLVGNFTTLSPQSVPFVKADAV